ncbi:entericidin A/B family lipoprotein [Billgrantia bachuensis]|uniref:Entericidin A/B family lipoprotein n=1 Tax=Billgrantia bachuensis TaxID=2717286 RepID=A0ABX0PUL4_9GAMM|nr:entericidin A/B family lipoprotein [Halomonas bachuensis]NIC07117.1 entericidin A/B family lipoprotein [Halomonas bachuensis]
MKRAIALSFALLMAAGALAGCNTMEGAGEDVERGGQAVQDAAE